MKEAEQLLSVCSHKQEALLLIQAKILFFARVYKRGTKKQLQRVSRQTVASQNLYRDEKN